MLFHSSCPLTFCRLKQLLCISVLLLHFPTLLGGSESHGGDVVVCKKRNDQGFKAAFFRDYFDARYSPDTIATFQFHQYSSTSGVSPIELALEIIKKIRYVDPDRYQSFETGVLNFEREAFIGRVIMPEITHDQTPLIIDDSVTNLQSCEIRQVAYQLKEPDSFIGERRYYIKSKYWNRLDIRNKATLILHEVVYREAIRIGHKKAKYSEAFVKRLIDQSWQLDLIEYEKFIENIQFGKFAKPGKSKQ